jgi:hypothetical protein
MTALAGRCRFTEATNGARIFALCDFTDRTVLVPISVAGNLDVRGIKCSADSQQLELRMSHLPATLQRIFVGLTSPRGHHLGEADSDFALRLTVDSGITTDILLPRALGAQNRYALLAILRRTGATWDGRRLREPQVFADRTKLGEAHKLPSWWTSRA